MRELPPRGSLILTARPPVALELAFCPEMHGRLHDAVQRLWFRVHLSFRTAGLLKLGPRSVQLESLQFDDCVLRISSLKIV